MLFGANLRYNICFLFLFLVFDDVWFAAGCPAQSQGGTRAAGGFLMTLFPGMNISHLSTAVYSTRSLNIMLVVGAGIEPAAFRASTERSTI